MNDKEIKFCQKIHIPSPKNSSIERMRYVMSLRNERKLYRRKCNATGKEIISAYPAESIFKIYDNHIWWGDTWDAIEYGKNTNLNRPFWQQYAELQKEVPREGTSVFKSENCNFNSHIRESKNCYLNALIVQSEDCMYCYWVVSSKNVIDSIYTNYSTLCYKCVDVNSSYNCIKLEESNNCHDCFFSFQLKGCDHCIFCSNLANKSYAILNKTCTKEEFETFCKKIFDGSLKTWNDADKKFKKVKEKTIHKAIHNLNAENCRGDHLFSCKNCHECFDGGYQSEDCYNTISFAESKNIYSSYSLGWAGCEQIYASSVMRGCTNAAFCYYCWYSHNIRYCDSCISCENCFGCIGLRHKKFCIFNKQYTEQEYETLIQKLIKHMQKTGEWGEYLPHSLNIFAYNETAANDYMPLKKEEALKQEWRWKESDKKEYLKATLPQIPDSIYDLTENIIKDILTCKDCGKNYRIILSEFHFYKKTGIPIPRNCPDCRTQKRIQKRNPYNLTERICEKCKKIIETTYPSGRPETIYCESCYLKEIY